MHIEYPDNISNKKVELPNIYPLIDKNGENRFWSSGSSFGQDNEAENFAIYENELIIYVRGLNNVDIRNIFFLHDSISSVTWTDEINNRIQYGFTIGDDIVFED